VIPEHVRLDGGLTTRYPVFLGVAGGTGTSARAEFVLLEVVQGCIDAPSLFYGLSVSTYEHSYVFTLTLDCAMSKQTHYCEENDSA